MASSQQSPGRIIVVLGMHRSGTSVLTQCIHLLGASMASQVIAPAAAINRDGFFEDAIIVALNEQLLSLLGSSWYDFRSLPNAAANTEAMQNWRSEALTHLRADYAGAGVAVIKDPRMSRVYSHWAPLFRQADLGVELVHILRQPEEVAVSLQRRNRMPPAYSLLLWCAHIFDILELMENNNSASTVLYKAFIDDPENNIQLMAGMLAGAAANEPDYSSIAAVVGKPFSVSTPSHSDALALIPELYEFALRLYQSLACHWVDGKLMLPGNEREQLVNNYASLSSRCAAAFATLRVLTEELMVINGELVRIGELHANAQAIVQQRDGQLAAVHNELSRVGAELEHAQSVVAQRDDQLALLTAQADDLNNRIAGYESMWFRRGWRRLRRSQS